jgi:nucleoid DNA-binding protein
MDNNRPLSMSTKDYLLRVMSVRTKIPLKTLEAVIEHQFKGMLEAMQTSHSVELSGFGKFLFNNKKAQKKYDKQLSKIEQFENKLKQPDLTERQIASYSLKLENTKRVANDIKPKLKNEQSVISDMGGVAESGDSSLSVEGKDRTNLPSEDGSL